MYVDIQVTEQNAKLLAKFAKAEAARATRAVRRLQNKIDALYTVQFQAEDFNYMIQSKLDDLSRY